VFNLGTGTGYSVRQLIDVCAMCVQQPIAVTHHPRRPGDAAVLVANSNKIKNILGWQPQYSDLEKFFRMHGCGSREGFLKGDRFFTY